METPLPDRHSLVMHGSNAWQRRRTHAWVTDALARGDKVLHRAVDAGASLGALGESARRSGQLEVLDAHRCHEQTDGRHWALRQLHEELIDQALADGYPGVLLTLDEYAMAVMAPEAAERLAYEHDLERITAPAGVRALCCYDVRVEQPDLLDAVAGVHHRCVEDILWSAHVRDDRMFVRGEIDAHNGGRFGATLRVAAAHGVGTVDLAGVTVLSAVGVRAFDGAVDLVQRRGGRLRLVNMSPTVHRALTLLRFADDHRVELVARPEGAAAEPAPVAWPPPSHPS